MARYYFSCPKIYFGEEAITSLCQFNNKRVGIVTDDFMMSSGKTRYLISHMPEASVCIFGEVTPDPDIDILTSGAARFQAKIRRKSIVPPPTLLAMWRKTSSPLGLPHAVKSSWDGPSACPALFPSGLTPSVHKQCHLKRC